MRLFPVEKNRTTSALHFWKITLELATFYESQISFITRDTKNYLTLKHHFGISCETISSYILIIYNFLFQPVLNEQFTYNTQVDDLTLNKP